MQQPITNNLRQTAELRRFVSVLNLVVFIIHSKYEQLRQDGIIWCEKRRRNADEEGESLILSGVCAVTSVFSRIGG